MIMANIILIRYLQEENTNDINIYKKKINTFSCKDMQQNIKSMKNNVKEMEQSACGYSDFNIIDKVLQKIELLECKVKESC